jgi:hypothetical protein
MIFLYYLEVFSDNYSIDRLYEAIKNHKDIAKNNWLLH